MKNIRHILTLSLLAPFFSLAFMPSALGFGDYQDHHGNKIAFEFLSKNDSSGLEERQLLVSTFVDNYKDLKPAQIKSHFKSQEDVKKYIESYYDSQWGYFINADHPIKLIHILKNKKLIGAAIIEQLDNEKDTLHLRELAILPNEQRHGYGAALIEALKNLPEMPADRIIADTRILNMKARQFYKKIGFHECAPHDPDLIALKGFIGLEWKREAVRD